MSPSITWVDAFSDRPYGGNPAAVCLPETPLADEVMQSLAFELGIAETAFVSPADTPGEWHLRWFSPATEIDLCGHATLASAHAMRERGVVDGSSPVTFHTRSGPLVATFDGDLVALDFPATPLTPMALPAPLQSEFAADQVIRRWAHRLLLHGDPLERGRGAGLPTRPVGHHRTGGKGTVSDGTGR